jgi:hypothetical protein
MRDENQPAAVVEIVALKKLKNATVQNWHPILLPSPWTQVETGSAIT